MHIWNAKSLGGEAFGRFVDSTSLVDVGFASIVCALRYWRFAEHIRRVAKDPVKQGCRMLFSKQEINLVVLEAR